MLKHTYFLTKTGLDSLCNCFADSIARPAGLDTISANVLLITVN